jgi:hypothetical protein
MDALWAIVLLQCSHQFEHDFLQAVMSGAHKHYIITLRLKERNCARERVKSATKQHNLGRGARCDQSSLSYRYHLAALGVPKVNVPLILGHPLQQVFKGRANARRIPAIWFTRSQRDGKLSRPTSPQPIVRTPNPARARSDSIEQSDLRADIEQIRNLNGKCMTCRRA